MATTSTDTVLELCTDALRKAKIVAVDEAASAYDIEVARRSFGRMMKSWQNDGPNLWAYASQSLTLTTAASYELTVERPLDILNARYKDSTEIPMNRMTREEYDALPIKTSQGIPTNFYYDRQREDARFYVWPVLAAASGQTIEITYLREFEDPVLTEIADVPGEWYDCVVYCLADRLSDDYGKDIPKVTARAQMLYDQALSYDREYSTSFVIGD